uniref:Uncharacterized protein n=1 Tax=Phlebotomus papatasi TaxID=29031 RepID=A0A1B0DEJ8_PHLPP
MRWSTLGLVLALLGACVAQPSDSYYGDDYNSLYTPTDRTLVPVVDNRKPAFRDCKGYAPSVKEEQTPGTFVFKVEADDPDEADTIEYSFVTAASERPKFRIDAKTGVIVTAYTFDRDEPIREKEVYVTVRATDNGRPPLDDVCTFKVTIEDINDNPPVFDKAKYEESMSEDTQVNRVVMRISASDFDDGDN